MYVGLQETGKCHISETEPRFQFSQAASPCLQPWRRENLEKMSEYPQEEVIPLLFSLLSCVGFGPAL